MTPVDATARGRLPDPRELPPAGAEGSEEPEDLEEPREVVRVLDASVVLGSSLVLDGVSLTVSAGESVALLGANGSGKSTLVRAVLGLVPTVSGSVHLMGTDVTRRGAVSWDRVGYVPQRVTAAAGVPATALEVVRSGLLGPRHLWRDRGRRARQRAMEALDAVGLADRAGDHVQVLSGGQSQRVLIARALVRSPELLVLDEPLAGIDRDSRESLARTLTGLRASGLTLVTVLHEMGELAEVVERVVVLADGRLVADSPAHEHTPDEHEHPRAHRGAHGPGRPAHPARPQDTGPGRSTAVGCEHLHPHGDALPAAHHAPVLRTPAPTDHREARS